VSGAPPGGSTGPVLAGAASRHGNHVSVDAQVSADGTVVVETAAWLASGFLVVRRDDGGQPGAPIGHAPLDGAASRTDVEVSVDQSVWEDWSGNRTLWAVIHFDDGDGQFDPATDRPAVTRSPAAQQSFALGEGDAPARVLARQFDPLALRDGRVTVRAVALEGDGHLVATAPDSDEVVGTRRLAAGRHENVTLSLSDSFVADQDREFRLRLHAYRSDGDGSFGDGDRPVRVGGSVVGTEVFVTPANASVDATAAPRIVTPGPTATPPSGVATGTTPPATPATGGPTGTAASGPGFSLLASLCALLAGVAVALARRRTTRP